jgi:quercetin dioxygenase-like cupin family protein
MAGAHATGVNSTLSVVAFWLVVVACAFITQPVSAADYQSGVTVKKLVQTTVTGNGQQIVYPSTGRPEVTAMTVEIAPGAETGWHSHPIPVYAYVVSGALDVELEGGKTLAFNEGDAVIEVVNTLHNGKNTGSLPVKLVVFYTGVMNEPTVIKAP